ncbi:MAG: sulfurtransferase TusA family protein [Proteobacteria bacterium]|nr:sulfurtransferase TusA family protein [Pseudomonadota bacterium]
MSKIPIDADDIKTSSTIDVEDLNCPLPLLRTKKTISKLLVGDILQVNGLQANFRLDLKWWCERNGHSFLGEKEVYGKITFFVKKG